MTERTERGNPAVDDHSPYDVGGHDEYPDEYPNEYPDEYPDEHPDGYDALAALDFSAPAGQYDSDGHAESELDAVDGYIDATKSDQDSGDLGAGVLADLDADPDDELVVPRFEVTNPPGTVTVATFLDGRVEHVYLDHKVTSMTEAQLAEEILVVARLATQDARSAQYAFMLEGMRQQGHDDAATRDFLSRDLRLPSPEEADAERATVFANRYAGEHD